MISVNTDTATARSSSDSVGTRTGASTTTGLVREPCPLRSTFATPLPTPAERDRRATSTRFAVVGYPARDTNRSASLDTAIACTTDLGMSSRHGQLGVPQ